MNVKLKPRFFLILLVLIVSVASSMLYYKRTRKESVLAADTKSTYSLVDPTSGVVQRDVPRGSAGLYDPVTISYTVKKEDTLASVAQTFHADAQTILDYPYNNIGDDLNLKVGQILIIPNGYIGSENAPILPPIPVGTGQFLWPVNGVVSQYASWFHPGAIDIGIALGTPVVAADDGTVIDVSYSITGYGNHVIISHGGGLTSLYAHLSETRVSKGQGIHKGDILGLSGSTGRSTGPHLHFEVRKSGQPVDPMTLLPPQ